MQPLVSACILITACLAPALAAARPKCGTMQLLQEISAHPGARSAVLARTAAPEYAARTLLTAHFAVHYSLREPHLVRLDPALDSAFIRLADSLYTAAGGSAGYAQDQEVVNALDAMGAPHPAMAQRTADDLEAAWSYFAGHLGMRSPALSTIRSGVYNAANPNRYSVELADIGSAVSQYRGEEIYALTYPPGAGGGILLDNDFRFQRTFGGGWDSIQSSYNSVQPPVVKNYAILWEQGLDVTVAHEFYHAIQYAYTTNFSDFHFWWEASATAMEERLAGGVNDYLQYLPSIFGPHATTSLDYACTTCLEQYGNGIFHGFLTAQFGEDFDVGVWEDLGSGKYSLTEALTRLFGRHQTTMARVYPAFTLPLVFTQSDGPPPFTPFTPDLSLWPKAVIRTQALDQPAPLAFGLPPLTWDAVLFTSNSGGLRKRISVSAGAGLTVTLVQGQDTLLRTGGAADWNFFLPTPASSQARNLALFSNGSWDTRAQISITSVPSVTGPGLLAYPNPATQSGSSPELFFIKPAGRDTVPVEIFDESGLQVRSLVFDSSRVAWSWDMRDQTGRRCGGGLYFYRVPGGALKSLLLVEK